MPEKASGSVAPIGCVIEQLSGVFARYRSELFRDGDAAGIPGGHEPN